MPKGRSEIPVVERIITELGLLNERVTIRDITDKTGFLDVTVRRDVEELHRLGIVTRRTKITPSRGKNPITYMLKSQDILKFKSRPAVWAFEILDLLYEHRRKGLTEEEIRERLGYPINETRKLLNQLCDIKRIYKEKRWKDNTPVRGGGDSNKIIFYKPAYEIRLIGRY